MKYIRCLSLCLVAQFALPGHALAAEPESAYQQAVNAYVEAASNELQALRVQGEAARKAAPPDKEKVYKDFFAKLEKCEAIHEELKKATAKDFDKTKALYEHERGETIKAWAKISGS